MALPAMASKMNIMQKNIAKLVKLQGATPSIKADSYFSNATFQKTGSELNAQIKFPFKPSKADTVLVINRRLSNNAIYRKDTLKFSISTANTIPIPFARIPLKKDVFKTLFLDKYGTGESPSQQAFID